MINLTYDQAPSEVPVILNGRLGPWSRSFDFPYVTFLARHWCCDGPCSTVNIQQLAMFFFISLTVEESKASPPPFPLCQVDQLDVAFSAEYGGTILDLWFHMSPRCLSYSFSMRVYMYLSFLAEYQTRPYPFPPYPARSFDSLRQQLQMDSHWDLLGTASIWHQCSRHPSR